MKNINFNDWSDTATILHMVTQMMGKAKLTRMEPQPQWQQILLQLTAEGFSTGLIPYQARTFAISLHLREGRVITNAIDGRSSGFSFSEGASVADYYSEFQRMLSEVMCYPELYAPPMDISVTIPFELNTQPRGYDHQKAIDFQRLCAFAHNALLRFIAPYRGKKTMPSFFWGTFDVSAMLFNGKPKPYEGGGIIERVAYDEQMIQFGFRPGEESKPEARFFIMPYPFVGKDLSNEGIEPEQAYYHKERAGFYLALEDVLAGPDPAKTVQTFFKSGYDIITTHEKWKNLDWLNQPLLTDKGSSALN